MTILMHHFTHSALCCLCLLFFALNIQAQTVLINPGDSWKYFDQGSEPSNWASPTFDDTAWAQGLAELGYGDGGEATVVNYGPDPDNKYTTTYFRKTIQITDASIITDLGFLMLYDDGIVVYINGNEVHRANMDAGPVNFSTFANALGTEATYIAAQVPATGLVNGANVIAVEIHQRNLGSSDISFDLSLVATITRDLISENAEWAYLDDGSDQGTLWSDLSFDDSSWPQGAAELGYGDGDETTVTTYGPDASNKFPTTYFRKKFNVANVDSLQYGVTMSLLRDDGAVVYLNGNEIHRSNMTTGSFDYRSYANSTASEGVWIDEYLTAAPFVQGENCIAVEIHNRNASSTDISFNLSLVPEEAPRIVRGPYLQKGTSNSMVIKWRTNVPSTTKVNYGAVFNTLSESEVDNIRSTEHELEITGLLPYTQYFYEIGDSSTILGRDSNYHFMTSPLIGTVGDYRLWVLGDCGTANTNARAVRNAYYNFSADKHTDMVLMLGDNAYNSGTDLEYQAAVFENMYEEMLGKSPLWSCPGNHDYGSANGNTQTGTYYDIFTFPKDGEAGGLSSGTEAYYSFDYGNVHIISLDSHDSDRTVGGSMLTWLENDLANTTQEWIVALWHHPPYTKGSHNSDTEGRLIEMRENVLPLLEDAGVDLVLNGHSHSYERSKFVKGHYDVSSTFNQGEMVVVPGSGKMDIDSAYYKYTDGHFAGDGAVYITAGSSGKISGGSLNHPVMQASLNELGSVVVDVIGDTMQVRFLNNNGDLSDYFTMIKKDNYDPQTDSDQDGYTDISECPDGWPCVDTDVDGIADLRDTDSDGDAVSDVIDPCRLGYELLATVLLQGPSDSLTGNLRTSLNTLHHVLPGQTPVNPMTTPTPSGQPYNQAPWNYAGTEGTGFTDADYSTNVVDWVLVSLRTDVAANTEVWKAAALLLADGTLQFIDPCLPYSLSGAYYLMVEHRNHLSILSPTPIVINNGRIVKNFTLENSYNEAAGAGQVLLPSGKWAMFSGDIDQLLDQVSFDINSLDRVFWEGENGLFGRYYPADVDMDGDVNAMDKIMWGKNNGISSRVPR